MATLESYIQQLERLKQALSNTSEVSKRVLVVAGKRLEAEYKKRIFVDGLSSSLKPIGKYATALPMYVNPKSKTLKGVKKSGFKPMGKNGKDTFKNGKKKKTKYVKDGWSGVRKLAGRQNQKVDLDFSSASRQSIQLGFEAGRLVLGSTSKERLAILRGQEKRFKKRILGLSQLERAAFGFAYNEEIRKIIKEIFQ